MIRRSLPPIPFPAAFGLAAAALAIALLACAGAANAASRAERVPRLVVPGPGYLRAGESVELRWAGGTQEVEELEILITVDGPRGRTVQISPQLDPRRGIFVWRVPELGRARARLWVRYNRDGHEIEGERGEALEILSSHDLPMDPALLPEPTGPDAGSAGGSGSAAAGARAGPCERRERAPSRERESREPAAESPSGVITTSVALPGSRSHTIPQFVPARN